MDKLSDKEIEEFLKWKKTNVGKSTKLEIKEGVSIDASSVKIKKEKRKCSEKQLAALKAGREKQMEKMLSLAKSKQ
jgi:hypothetical protein